MNTRIARAPTLVAMVLVPLWYSVAFRQPVLADDGTLRDAFPALGSRNRGPALYVADPYMPPSQAGNAAHQTALDRLSDAQYELAKRQEELAVQTDTQPVIVSHIDSDRARRRVQEAQAAVIRAEEELIRVRPNGEPAEAEKMLQSDTILLLFRGQPSVSTVRAVLAKHRLVVRSGIAEIALFVVELPPATHLTAAGEATRLRAVIRRLSEEKGNIIEVAVPNVALEANVVPPPTRPALESWFGGEHPLVASHFPEAWNFSAAIRSGARKTRVGVLDVGFLPAHDDLEVVPAPCGTPPEDSHGTAVAGVIAARFGDGKGVDGAAANFAEIVTCSPDEPVVHCDRKGEQCDLKRRRLLFDGFLAGLQLLLEADIRVINASIGYNWPNRIDPLESVEAQQIVEGHGKCTRKLLAQFSNAVVVAAAGNHCQPQENRRCRQPTKWTSPFTWAALGDDSDESPASKNVIIVEALDQRADSNRIDFSNEGMIGAAAVNIPTTIPNNAYRYCEGGTSCAAPVVTATIAMMLAYQPELSVDKIKQNLGIRSDGNGAVKLNAFEAIKACSPEAAFDLANLNGDHAVDMKDFDQFNAEYTEIHSVRPVPTLDQNRDGQCDGNDRWFCRIDLDGNGVIDSKDLDVMIRAWTGPPVDPETLRAQLGKLRRRAVR